jgi:NTE family protein
LNLALQGGGAHGAFTWGVLDRLLEEPGLAIEGISATSAGAMNAAVMAGGYVEAGRAGARAALDEFWRRVGQLGRFSPLRGGPLDLLAKAWNLEPTPTQMAFETLTRVLSPYQFNPLNWHPLRDILSQSIDFGALADSDQIKLFVSATNVRSGKIRVFHHNELNAEVLLASACLPFLFQAVEIDGEAYWDGGYMGNPAIYPLIYNCASPDVAIVQINPLVRDEVPKTAPEILDRVNEISFNSTLMREMRSIAFVTRLIEQKALDPARYKKMYIHVIEAEAEMGDFGANSKLEASHGFLRRLRDIGRRAAEDWLAAHYADIGVASSIDIEERFL